MCRRIQLFDEQKNGETNYIEAMEAIEVKIVKAIPYQLCPKCNGDGEVFVQKYFGENTGGSIKAGLVPCNVCFGAKVIPMFVLDKEIQE